MRWHEEQSTTAGANNRRPALCLGFGVRARLWREQVGQHISILFESTLEDPSLLTIPQHLLANEIASCTFADVLLSFLVHQMDDLAGYDERQAGVP